MAKARLGSLVMLVCACAAQTPPDPAAAKCRVAGQVVHFTSGEPLRKVQLHLKRFDAEGGVMSAPTVSNYATTSDAQGRFSFEGVNPGAYWLFADRTGYLEQSYGAREPFLRGSPLRLTAGQRREDLVMKLTPQSFVYGKVADEDGDLMPNAQVNLYRATWSRDRRKFQVVASANSQDDGSYVIGNLGPGRYYLSAAPIRRDDGAVSSDARLRETYATTYYPGVADPGSAAPVDVSAGAEVRGLEIRLRLARAFRIRGKAVNTSTGGPAARVNLNLTARDGIDASNNTVIGVMTGSDGSFEFQNVAPGDYLIGSGSMMGVGWIISSSFTMTMPTQPDKIEVKDPAATLIGRVAVHVGDQDVDNVVAALGEGVTVTGTIRMVDGDPSKPSPWPAFSLQPATGLNDEPAAAQVSADGTFRMAHLVPDRYAIQMDSLPPGVYVKSVRFDGQSVAGDNLDLTSAPGGVLEIALSTGGGSITGVVRGTDGEAAAGAIVQVCSGEDSVKSVGADENGAYQVDGLPPGDYRILAWEEVEPGLSQDPSFRSRFEGQSAAVTLAEHGRSTQDLKVIPHEAIEAEAAKLK